MITLFATFGIGSILGKSYLACHGSDENTIRIRLNADKLPWFSLYNAEEIAQQEMSYGLVRLPVDYEVLSEHNSGPCERREMNNTNTCYQCGRSGSIDDSGLCDRCGRQE